MSELCPCGSGLGYASCCGQYHHGSHAPTAVALMRSRYSAFVLRLADYLRDTWHVTTRPASLEFGNDEPRWCGLQILTCSAGGETDRQGEVEFMAHWYSKEGKCGALHERSRFVQEEGRWFYVDGQLFAEPSSKVGRNEPCPCGSGKKFKQCCGK